METIITDAATAAQNFDSLYQLASLFIVGGLAVVAFGLWIVGQYVKRKLADSNEAEHEQTAMRKAQRDAQIAEHDNKLLVLSNDIKVAHSMAEGVGKSLGKHIEHHEKADAKMEKLQENVHKIDKVVVQIHTILQERRAEKHKD